MIALNYLPILMMIGMGTMTMLLLTILGIWLGPHKTNKVKATPFESGMPSDGLGNHRHDVKFYMTALIFLIFDVEVVFLYPWAVKFRDLGWFGFVECLIFLGILTLGLVYVWKKGALEWE